MATIALWKVKRELVRLKVQAQALLMALYEPVLRKRYDKMRPSHVSVVKGGAQNGACVAIFLIHQPAKLAPSVLRTCRHLRESGFAPVVISNGPLQADSRTALERESLFVVERPNFGYDFGGYRDGVWLLEQKGMEPEKLLFLNDSVWFPVRENCDFLADMVAEEGDYIGTQLAGDPYRQGRKRGFFTSYCFMVNRPLLQSPQFTKFWNEYRMTSNKEVTLRRGERAFSHLMLDTAQKSGALFDQNRFERLVDGLTNEELDTALRSLVVTHPELIQRQTTLLERGPEDCGTEIVVLLKDATRSKNYIGAAPILCLKTMGFPMIKKNNERLYTVARKVLVDAFETGELSEILLQVQQEIREKNVQDRARLGHFW